MNIKEILIIKTIDIAFLSLYLYMYGFPNYLWIQIMGRDGNCVSLYFGLLRTTGSRS